jgi:PAS domain-containing protein
MFKDFLTAQSVHDRVEFIRYMYSKTGKYPTVIEDFVLPLAVYTQSGSIQNANSKFRSLTGLTEDDLLAGRANIYNYLNKAGRKNTGFTEAAAEAFDGDEILVRRLTCPLLPYTKAARIQLGMYHSAVFFPLAAIQGIIQYSALLLIRGEEQGQKINVTYKERVGRIES